MAGHVLAALLLLAIPFEPAVALVVTSNNLTISGITIAPAGGIASVDPWTASASASANNSLGQSTGQFDSSFSTALAGATVAFATGNGAADGGARTGHGDTAVNLPGVLNQAAATGQGSLFTFFTIIGGIGNVDVTLSMHLDGMQRALADTLGQFRNELVASLELDGSVVLILDDIMQGGPGFPDTTEMFATTLSRTLTLAYDTPYFVFIQADAEASGINLREPSGLVLVLGGLGLLVWYSRRRLVPQQHT